jgi:hypothetical protein
MDRGQMANARRAAWLTAMARWHDGGVMDAVYDVVLRWFFAERIMDVVMIWGE